jgi:hypothetical protein
MVEIFAYHGEMDCEEGWWVGIVQGLFLQSWISFTLKEVE